MHGWVMNVPNFACRYFSGIDAGAYIFLENLPLEIFNILFESIQKKQ